MGIEWRTPALCAIGISQRRVPVRAEHLEIHRRSERLELVAKIAQSRQAIIDIESRPYLDRPTTKNLTSNCPLHSTQRDERSLILALNIVPLHLRRTGRNKMEREAASAGIYETGGMKVPRLQILTVD